MRIVSIVAALAATVVSAQATAAETSACLYDSVPGGWCYDEHFSPAVPDTDRWWRNFDDPLLDSLIAMGMDYNYNVAMAMKRIEISRAGVEMARASYYPQVDLQAGWSRSRTSAVTGAERTAVGYPSYFNVGATVSWEIDVFGKIRKRVEEQKAAVDVSRAEYAAMQVSVAAQIASAYITLRTYQGQLAVAKAHIASQEHILHMTEARHEAGLASMLDVTQARVVLYSTEASIPRLEASIKTTINSIAVLTGRFPCGGCEMLTAPGPLPEVFHVVGIGVPADLLRRRPDVIEAECRLAADAAALGVAKKEFLPTLTLNGSIGTSAHRAGDLFSADSFTYSVAPTLSWTAFSGFSRRYAVAEAREQMMADIDNYNLTVTTAVEEVDNAIVTYDGTLANIALLEQTVEESDKSLQLAVDLYRNSLSSFTNVVDAQLNLLTYQNSLVAAQGTALQSLVNLYKALGGGWEMK